MQEEKFNKQDGNLDQPNVNGWAGGLLKSKLIEWMDINLSTQSKLGASDEVIRQLLSVRSFVENYPSLRFFTLDDMKHCFKKSREAFVFETPMRPTYKSFEDYMNGIESTLNG